MRLSCEASDDLGLSEEDLLGFGHSFLDVGKSDMATDDDAFNDMMMMQGLHTCTHRHICNPPGPDNTHTHVCSHTHTQLLAAHEASASTGDVDVEGETSTGKNRKKRSQGNREAVRKYREKKKALTAQLEQQLREQKILNQQLLRRLQAQTVLEAEVIRLRNVLAEIGGRVSDELRQGGSGGLMGKCIQQGDKAVRLIPVNQGQSLLPGGEFYLQTVELPCEPRHSCAQQSSRQLHAPYTGAPMWPSCDVASVHCRNDEECPGNKARQCMNCMPSSGVSEASGSLQVQKPLPEGSS